MGVNASVRLCVVFSYMFFCKNRNGVS